jgi:hypothetical protein
MPAVIRQHIRYAPLLKAESEELTSSEAAELAGVTQQAIRDWCQAYGIGEWSHRLKQYLVDRQRLNALLEKRRKRFA